MSTIKIAGVTTNTSTIYRAGIDCGSKTIKSAVLDPDGQLVYCSYLRHLTDIRSTLLRTFREMREKIGDVQLQITFTGSAGMQISQDLNIPFIQEVVASKTTVQRLNPDADVVIELGGEDSKILFLTGGEELRMNATCAGGTGGFIDTIAGMLGTNAAGLALAYPDRTTKRPIASRCAVFARNDVRSMLNEGASKGDIAASTFMAVVNQCVSGLACGRKIEGNVVFLGGPLHYLSPLVECFRETLGLDETTGVVPPNAHLYVAMGAAHNAVGEIRPISKAEERLEKLEPGNDSMLTYLEPLFESEEEYQQFKDDHKKYSLPFKRMWGYNGPMYFGVDSGSTTMKSVLCDADGNVLRSFYRKNDGDVITSVRWLLKDLYQSMMMAHTAVGPNAYIANVGVTGYGEDLLRKAFGFDCGLVETVAHLKAAQRIMPNVDSVLDIGGQDIKCIRVRDGHIDDISLNEACSSGCGGLLSGMAQELLLSDYDFSMAGVKADHPVDLGMRCAVFMTSRVRHAQKAGATAGDISAGMAYSVVKNALFRVMSVHDVSELGENVVVQGGTFKNDAVLRAFEKMLGRQVARTDAPELMGAYGAALFAIENDNGEPSTILNAFQASTVKADRASRHCDLCGNRCLLTETQISHSIDEACEWNPMIFVQKGIHSMGTDNTDRYREVSASFIMGNRCSRPISREQEFQGGIKLVDRQYERLFRVDKPAASTQPAPRGVIGIPRALEMYEQFPFWQAFFGNLGFDVRVSRKSSSDLYRAGMGNVTSESTCYPAKLAHGHAADLVASGVTTLFYPRMRNTSGMDSADATTSTPALDCPVICDYADIIKMGLPEEATLVSPRITSDLFDGAADTANEELAADLLEQLSEILPNATLADILEACKAGSAAMESYFDDVATFVEEARAEARKQNGWGAIMVSRPYHLDPEINHGIPTLLESYDLTAISSEAVWAYLRKQGQTPASTGWRVSDRQEAVIQWAAQDPDFEVISLYSFGCGIDVALHEEMRQICKSGNTTFTALKVDDMTDISSIRIRVRSLKATLEERERLADSANATGTESSAKSGSAAQTATPAPGTTLFIPNWMPTHMAKVSDVLRSHGYNVITCENTNGISAGVAIANSDLCQTILSAIGQLATYLQEGNGPAALLVPLACTNCCSRSIGHMAHACVEGFGTDQAVLSLEDLAAQDEKLRQALAQAIVEGDVDTIRACQTKSASLAPANADATALAVIGNASLALSPSMNNDVFDRIVREGCAPVPSSLATQAIHSALAEAQISYGARKESLKEFAATLTALQEDTFVKLASADGATYAPLLSYRTLEGVAEEHGLDQDILSGAGWTSEATMISLVKGGFFDILYAQTFTCLSNHVGGSATFKHVRSIEPRANLANVEYDSGISQVNQINRIKLLAALAKTR